MAQHPPSAPRFAPRWRLVKVALLSCVATVLATLLVLNLNTGEKTVTEQVRHEYALQDARYQRALGVLLGPPITTGNRFEALYNGDQIFPSMLEAIRGAQHSISFETYIYWSGDIGRAFADALSERARAGVQVHVLLDWLGSVKMDEALLNEMRDAGVEVERFHKPHWYTLARLNNRTHRKLLVIDGKAGFTGGVGIAPEWTGNAQSPEHWRDSHYKVSGPVVAQMQAVFMDNWMRVTGRVLHDERYFPPLPATGDGRAQMFSSSPSGGSESMHLMYLLSIAAATQSIDLAMAYFVPDSLTRDALVQARQRGVRVRIILPGPVSDTQTVRNASRAGWGPLLEAGVEIHEYQPTMYHCKVMVIDDLLVSVGSTNFDNRSFQLNDEANLNIYDADFAQAETRQLESDLAQSRRVTYDAWQQRPWHEKAIERWAALLSPQL